MKHSGLKPDQEKCKVHASCLGGQMENNTKFISDLQQEWLVWSHFEVFLATLWNTEVTLQCFIMPSQNSSLQLNIQTPNCCTLIYPNFQAAGHSSSQNKFLLRMKWPALNFWWELRAEPTRCHSPPLKRWFGARFFPFTSIVWSSP